jgi:hypothetical protein
MVKKSINMNLDKKIIEELRRFNDINRYVLNEQEPMVGGVPPAAEGEGAPIPPPAEGDVPPAEGDVPPAEGTEVPEPIDVASDPDVEEVGAEKDEEGSDDSDAEEIDITDLVTTQQEIVDKQDELMDGLFSRLDDLQSKLSHMDQIVDKINSLEAKFDKYRDKTPEEKLELRSLDSYPYNQKLTDFFDDKKIEMEKSGKNEYILTSDEVENFSPNEIKKTFNIYNDEEEQM